jgi:hypothetical protein
MTATVRNTLNPETFRRQQCTMALLGERVILNDAGPLHSYILSIPREPTDHPGVGPVS